MYIYYIKRVFAIILLLSGCQPSPEDEHTSARLKAQQIYTEAIAIHDEVMPLMDEIMRLQRQLKMKIDSLQQLDSADYVVPIEDMQETVGQLEQADEAMMQWMRTVEPVPDLMATSQQHLKEEAVRTDSIDQIQVQEEQKNAIELVKKQMEGSIEQARSLLALPDR